MRPVLIFTVHNRHAFAIVCGAVSKLIVIYIFDAPTIDAKLWCATPPMVRINSTGFAKIMPGSFCVPLIHAEIIFTCCQCKFFLGCGDHDCPFATANRTITPPRPTDWRVNFELNGAAMAFPVKNSHDLPLVDGWKSL